MNKRPLEEHLADELFALTNRNVDARRALVRSKQELEAMQGIVNDHARELDQISTRYTTVGKAFQALTGETPEWAVERRQKGLKIL